MVFCGSGRYPHAMSFSQVSLHTSEQLFPAGEFQCAAPAHSSTCHGHGAAVEVTFRGSAE